MAAEHSQNMGNTPAGRQPPALPIQPNTIEETGLSFLFLVELIVKVLFLRGQLRLMDLAAHSKLSVGVLEPLLAFLRTERLCEASRSRETETAIAYTLTELGRLRAEDYLKKSLYAGPAPVSMHDYVERVRKQSIADMRVTHADIKQAFSGLTIRDSLLTQFGAALNSSRSIFVYGPPGSGKTFIAEHLVNLLSGDVAIPHAIAIENEVIQIFDPLFHKPSKGNESNGYSGIDRRRGRREGQDNAYAGEDRRQLQAYVETAEYSGLDRRQSLDARWVICRRPVIQTGGELALSMLDLDFDEGLRYYQAPPQLKANNGLLIVDDLGRQLAPAISIMNRWIVPLDRRVDYLALRSGKKLMLPFDVIVVFSTNMPPSKLEDEAFLRRLGYKIYVGELSEEEYRTIARQVCHEFNIPYSDKGISYLIHDLHRKGGRPLYACIPRDILGQVRDIAQFEEVEPELSESLLNWAWNNYFARD